MNKDKRSAPALQVSDGQKKELSQIIREHKSGQQLVKRSKIILLGSEGLSNNEVSRRLKVSVNTIKQWRRRWASSYVELEALAKEHPNSVIVRKSIIKVLSDFPRSGKPKKFSLIQEQQIVSLACDKPENHGLEMTQWSEEMLAKVAVAEGLVKSISRAQVGRILKNTPVTTT